MAKPPKTPRPQKPPIQPPRQDEKLEGNISLVREKLIGRLVINWSLLESSLNNLVWDFLNLDVSRGRVMTSRMDVRNLVSTIRDLGAICAEESDFFKLSPILDEIDILREQRNLVVHGIWAVTKRGETVSMSLKTKPLEPDQLVAESFSTARLKGIIEKIRLNRLHILKLGIIPLTQVR